MSESEGLCRVRVWVDGSLLEEDFYTAEQFESLATEIASHHADVANAANDADQSYLIEFFDPNEAEGEQYFRFGTDDKGMVAPMPLADVVTSGIHPWFQA